MNTKTKTALPRHTLKPARRLNGDTMPSSLDSHYRMYSGHDTSEFIERHPKVSDSAGFDAFVLTTPDAPDVQQRFAPDRGWNFRMLSTKGTTFKHDMGFEAKPGEPWPGVSVFRKDENGQIFHVSKSFLGPGDPYCAVWHFFDLLPSERKWEPKYHYV